VLVHQATVQRAGISALEEKEVTYCPSCDVTEHGHYAFIFGRTICKYEEIREVLWLAKIRNEEGALR
jgi:hypothetical protein